MRLKMMGGGGAVDYDSLTATAADVPEGLTFIGKGSEDEKTGTLPDQENLHGSPGRYTNPSVPVHPSISTKTEKDTNGKWRVILAPPKGKYPGSEKAFVGCFPVDIGIVSEKIANGQTIAGVTGTYGSDSTAVAKDIRSGKVAYNKDGRIAGTAVDYGKISRTIGAGESTTIKEGFYGEGKVTAKDLASQTSGNLDASKMLEGQHGYSNGKEVWGNRKDRGSLNKTLAAGESCSIDSGMYSGGTVAAKDLASQTSGNLDSWWMVEGQHGYSNGKEVWGSRVNRGDLNKTLAAGESCSIDSGMYSGGTIQAKDLASQTPGNLESWQMLSGQHGYSNGQVVWGSMADRGAWADAGGMGEGDNYYAFNKMPCGCYRNWADVESWAPEARLSKDAVRSYLGVDAWKIIQGQAIAGIWGSAQVFKFAEVSQTLTASDKSKAIWDPNMSKNFYYKTGHVYPSGFKEIYLAVWTGGNAELGWLVNGGVAHYYCGGTYNYAHMASEGSLTFTNTDIEIPINGNGYFWIWIAGVSS